jgi:hypothetical protein
MYDGVGNGDGCYRRLGIAYGYGMRAHSMGRVYGLVWIYHYRSWYLDVMCAVFVDMLIVHDALASRKKPDTRPWISWQCTSAPDYMKVT